MNLSVSEENYIKSIYHLQLQSDKVTTNELAKALSTKAASVTDMLKKLQKKKLIRYKKYYGFNLNEKGNRMALEIIRRHRLWEYFLVFKLGFEWDKVHTIAEEMEHVSSPELIKKLDAFLDHPTTDPHGDPIPDKNGDVPVIRQINLYGLEAKQQAVISSVSNQSAQMLEVLKHLEISIGAYIKVIKIFDFDSSVEVKIGKQQPCILSEQVAKNIFVYHD
ncbi:metal-dependent transcriptional regulator [soil metagenome]